MCDYQNVSYFNRNYTIALIKYSKKLFIIDYHNRELIENHPWTILSNGYIGYKKDNKIIYLHRHIFGEDFDGTNYIDHINRFTTDNREINLRIVSQTTQNHNQKDKQRGTNLPIDCGISPLEIPRHVYYISASSDGHSEGFCIEINGVPKNVSESGRIIWKIRNSIYSLREKLNITILNLKELRNDHPELRDIIKIIIMDEEKRKELITSYNNIIKLSTFSKEIIQNNILTFKSDIFCPDISKDDEYSAEKMLELSKSGKKKDNNLPAESEIKKSDIPKYCYYVPATETRGDKFIIDKHPKLIEKELRQLSTPESKLLTTKQKFDILLEYLHCLENDLPIVKKDTPKGKRGQFNSSNSTTYLTPLKSIKIPYYVSKK